MTPRSDFLADMTARGAVHQCTDAEALDAAMLSGPVTAYVGFDATAPSLHVGHLVSLMALRRLQRHGHRAIVLLGGGTTKVGDPSFRDASRPMLDDAAIAANGASLSRTFSRFVDFAGSGLMLDNAAWLDPLGFISFLREVGVHFTVARMLSFDSVRTRMEREESLTLLEFNYMCLQAFDFLHLAREHDCTLQMGGSDQWGNIVNGVELARRTDGRRLHGLTLPLLANAAGEKMGKTASGAVWLDPERLGSFELWQWWRDVADADVGRFLRLLTDLPLAEIERLEALGGSEANVAKVALADAVVGLVHGESASAAARSTSEKAFSGDSNEGLPTVTVDAGQGDVGLVDLLVRAGLAASKGEARRAVAGGGVRIDGTKAENADTRVAVPRPGTGGVRLSLGRKRHVVVVSSERS